jgi:hypothetical protein
MPAAGETSDLYPVAVVYWTAAPVLKQSTSRRLNGTAVRSLDLSCGYFIDCCVLGCHLQHPDRQLAGQNAGGLEGAADLLDVPRCWSKYEGSFGRQALLLVCKGLA